MTKPSSLEVNPSVIRGSISVLSAFGAAIVITAFHHHVFSAFVGLMVGTLIWRYWERQLHQQKKWSRNEAVLGEQLSEKSNRILLNEQTIINLEHQISSNAHTIEQLKQELCQLEESQKNKITGLEAEEASLRHQLNELRDLLDSVIAEDHRHLADKAELEQQNQSLAVRVTQLEIENSQLKEQNESLESKVDQLRHKISDDILFALLPNVEFLRDSTNVLWKKVRNPVTALRKIREISEGTVRAERVESASEWLELRCGDDWRIYFRKCQREAKYQIFISSKKSQEKDFRWVKQQPLC